MSQPVLRDLSRYFSILFLVMATISQTVNASGFSPKSSFQAAQDSSVSDATTLPEFLKVDQAFQFESELTAEGIRLRWNIAPEYYLYLERFKFKATNENTLVGPPQYSTQGEAKEDPYFGQVHVIHDELEVFLPVTLAENLSEDEIKITYQGCAEAGLCYPPKNQYLLFTATNDASPAADSAASPSVDGANAAKKPSASNSDAQYRNLEDASGIFNFIQDSSLPLIIGIFFLLGLGLTFTPCVFPMIPIITSIIAGQQKPTTGKSLALSLAYVLGMALTYAAAGVITGMLGAGANVQAALQDPFILSFFAAVFVLLSFAMFGFYELQLPAFIRDRLNTTSQNLSGGHVTSVFFIGALSALVVSPCVSAPLAGALLYISSTADAVIGGASLFALGLGMGVPLIIIAVSGSKLLPKAGQWMNQVKYVFGIMLLAVAVWLLSRFLSAQISMLLWAVLIGITGVQMGAFEAANSGWQKTFKGAGLILAFYAATLLLGALTGAHDPLKPLDRLIPGAPGGQSSVNTKTEKVAFNKITSLNGLEAELEKAQAAGKPVMLDFYADWCISCIVMENNVFPLPHIRSKLETFHLVKADVTPNSEDNQALMNHFGLFGPPSILFFDKDGKEIKHLRIIGEISESGFDLRLIQALE